MGERKARGTNRRLLGRREKKRAAKDKGLWRKETRGKSLGRWETGGAALSHGNKNDR